MKSYIAKLISLGVIGGSLLFAAPAFGQYVPFSLLAVYNRGYYPWAQPSRWYVLPGEAITFSGSGFAPNESITIKTPTGSTMTFSANNSGTFSNQATYAVPFSIRNSTQRFSLSSSISGKTIEWNIVIGTFYPNLEPSNYYVPKNISMGARASGFAPNEPVQLLVQSNVVAQATADAAGNAVFTFSTPMRGGTFTLFARGMWSMTSSARVVTLVQ